MNQRILSRPGCRTLLLAVAWITLSAAASAQIVCSLPNNSGCATCPGNACRSVTVGGNGSTIPFFFQDGVSGNSASTIFASTYIRWSFIGLVGHTSTSGTPGAPDGKWSSVSKANNQTYEVFFNN